MTQAMDCPYCETVVIGESLDLLKHIREDHPSSDLLDGEEGGSPRDVLFEEAFEERFKAEGQDG